MFELVQNNPLSALWIVAGTFLALESGFTNGLAAGFGSFGGSILALVIVRIIFG